MNKNNTLELLLEQQLALLDEQLQFLHQYMPGQSVDKNILSTDKSSPTLPAASHKKTSSEPDEPKHSQPAGRRALVKSSNSPLSDRQQRSIDTLKERYCSKTKTSKNWTDEHRSVLADNRTIAGFNILWKEMTYQIVSKRSKGSKIYDIDDNEYVDTTLCFGANLLGHSPSFIVDAIKIQLDMGYEVGQQNLLVGEVCDLIKELTGNERMTFTHSGCEAVQYAIRIARAATARNTIVIFQDDIHGRGDSVLGRSIPTNDGYRTLPMAMGITQEAVNNTVVLQYGSDEALAFIKQHGDEIAAVIVEPVRTRSPDLQPIEFLKEIRSMTTELGALLIFDEVVMGFRVHPAGAQGYFNIRADLTIYGKTIGGGLPIGIVAGKSEYIDFIDGGMWHFGDDSIPESGMTIAGGTMIKHPLSMAASLAFLRHLKSSGGSLQLDLNQRTSDFAEELNAHFKRHSMPIHLQYFSSYYLPTFLGDKRFEGLFYIYLRLLGVHIYMDYPCFLSTAHTEKDIEFMSSCFKKAADYMLEENLMQPTNTSI